MSFGWTRVINTKGWEWKGVMSGWRGGGHTPVPLKGEERKEFVIVNLL